jgi:hypothetical protein
MLENPFRPWGLLPWVFDKLPKQKWRLIGCLAPEERCLGALESLFKKNLIDTYLLLEIIDPADPKFTKESNVLRNKIKNNLNKIDKDSKDHIFPFQLFESPFENVLNKVESFFLGSNDNIVLDISSLPKKYFFPILKRLISKSHKVKNLLVTYTIPEGYGDGELAWNPLNWNYFPSFGPEGYEEAEPDIAFIGVGFLPFRLGVLLKEKYENASVQLFFPFPPGPPNFQRTWEFVRKIQSDFRKIENDEITRVGIVDVPEIFRQICKKTGFGKRNALFAPYGPKTFSLAMCIYACKKQSPVYYTQPTIYNPFYCHGINKIDGDAETYVYCLKLDGMDLYDF